MGCRKIVSQCKSAKGRKKLAIMDGSTLVKVLHGEYQGNFNQGNFDDREEISLKCDGLEKEIASLYKEIARMTYERANSGKPMHDFLRDTRGENSLSLRRMQKLHSGLRKVTDLLQQCCNWKH